MISNRKSNLTIAFTLMLVASVFLLEAQGFAQSQRDAVCQGDCGGACGPCPSSGGGGGGWFAPRAPSPPKPTAAEIADQKSGALNDQGLAASERKDWAAAEGYFRKALKLAPSDHAVLRNLAITLAHEGEEAYTKGDYTASLSILQESMTYDPVDDTSHHVIVDDLAAAQASVDSAKTEVVREEQQEIHDKLSADDMKDSLSRMVNSLSSESRSSAGVGKPDNTSTGSEGLAFTDAAPSLKDAVADTSSDPTKSPESAPKSSGSRAPAKTGGGTGIFGTTSNPTNPGLDFSAAPPVSAVKSATDQLTSAAGSGAAAKAGGISNEAAATEANCAFNTEACAKPTSVPINKSAAQTPGATELATHILPAARIDISIQQSMAYYEKLDGKRLDAQTKLAAVQQQINTGSGDSTVLDAQKATLKNDLTHYEADQATTQEQIKKRLVEINLPWSESPAPATAGAAVNP